MKKLFFVPILFVFCSCSSSLLIKDTYRAGDIDFNSVKKSKIAIYGVNSLTVNEFVKTFRDEYYNTTKLNNKILSTFNKEFNELIPSVTSIEKNEKVPSFLTGEFSFKENNSKEVSKFFNGLGTDHLVFINNFSVGNPSYFLTRGNSIMSGELAEQCVVSMEVELWDVKHQKRLMKYQAGGERTVVLFSLLTALNGAIENSVDTAVRYLKNNGIAD
jgi:hypothetical protein